MAAVMFGMGLSLTLADFRRVLKVPKAAIIGLIGQLALLPAIAFMVSVFLALEPEIAIGLIVLSASPGGISSNSIVFAARADLALSISLTAISSMVTVITLPFIVGLGLEVFLTESESHQLPFWTTVFSLLRLTVVPVAIGMALRSFFPEFAAASARWFRPAGIVVLVIMIGISVYADLDHILAVVDQVIGASIILSVLCLAVGYIAARLFSLEPRQAKTIAIEIGVQNVAVAIFVTMSLLHVREFAVVPIVYGVLSYLIVGMFLAVLSRSQRHTAG